MKVIVLGIDGLEASLVERWKLRGLKQEDWGLHDVTVAIDPGEKLYTPIIWAAFLLGKKPSYHGFSYRKIKETRSKVAYGILYPLFLLRLKLFPGKELGLRKFMVRTGLFSIDRLRRKMPKVERMPREAVENTVVKKAEKRGYRVWIKEFPSYNDQKLAEIRAYFWSYFDSSLRNKIRYLDDVYNISLKLFEEALQAARENDLILYYNPVIDYANHMLYRPGKLKPMFYLATYYRRVERLVDEVGRVFRDSAILVVSDHGYDPKIHEHSEHGFWSCNKVLENKPRTILDFHNLILDLLAR